MCEARRGGECINRTWNTYTFFLFFFVMQERGRCSLHTLSLSPSLEFSHTSSPFPLAYSTSYISLSFFTSSSTPTSPLHSPNFSFSPTFSTSLNTTSVSTDTGGEQLGTEMHEFRLCQMIHSISVIFLHILLSLSVYVHQPFCESSLFSLSLPHLQPQV